ncbi:MAG: GNAT family N-acetyltransferase [Clostridium sp.]
MHRDYCNKGYASEAAQALLSLSNTLHLNKVTARCDSRNSASMKIMETLGILNEGYSQKIFETQ